MRQILVDQARMRLSAKRGAGERPVALDEQMIGPARLADLLALDEALTQLARLDERKARVIELCHFAGLTQQEVAEALDVHVNTVARDLRLAEAWLHRHLRA
jgi:RNA polymerase sigma factor (TIGR02999 family)